MIRIALAAAVLLLTVLSPAETSAFGRNKVQYDTLNGASSRVSRRMRGRGGTSQLQLGPGLPGGRQKTEVGRHSQVR